MKQILMDRVIMLNASVLAGINFLQIEAILELLLLLASLVYTIVKMIRQVEGNATINNWIDAFFDKNKRDKSQDE